MIANQRRHQHLLLLIEARQIAVLQNISRVAVHSAVVNIQPHFVQHHRPFQQRRQIRVVQFGVLFLPLLEYMGGGFQYPTRLLAVNVVLVCQTLRGAAADILMAKTSLHLIQHAFTQRAIRQAQLFDRQRIENAAEDSQPRSKHRFAFFRQTRQAERVKVFILQHFIHQHFKAFRGDKTVFLTHRHQHFLRSFNGAGGAQRHIPALDAELPRQRFQLLHGRQTRALEILFVDGAAGEIDLREADAAHTTALNQTRFEILANHQLRRTTADINDQLTATFRLRMFDAHKDQARFFVTGDYLYRIGNHLFRALEKFRGVGGLA